MLISFLPSNEIKRTNTSEEDEIKLAARQTASRQLARTHKMSYGTHEL